MTYHDALAPRSRRPWLIALPLAIVLALGAAWCALWFYARGEAEVRLADWQTKQAKGGRSFTCGSQTVGGFPFRIEVTCADADVVLNDTQPPIALKVKQILAVAQIWDPKLIIAEFTSPMTASDPGGAPYASATWTLAQASVRGTPEAPERASIVADGLRLNGAGGATLFESKHAEFHARVQFGSWSSNPAIDLAANLVAAAAPGVHPLAAQPFDADILAVLHGMKDLSPKPLPVRLREWQAAGGKLEIQKARLAQGDTLANTTGVMALSQRGALDGSLQVAAVGLERFLPAIGGGGGATNLERAAPALGAIERAVPGLVQRIAPQQQQSLQAGLLGLLGQPVDVEGKRGIAVPVRFTDGAASVGPIPIGKVAPLF